MDAFAMAGLAKVVVRTLLTNSASQWSGWEFSESNGLLFALVTGSREAHGLATIANGSKMVAWTSSHLVVNREDIVIFAQRSVGEVLARSTVSLEHMLPYIESNQSPTCTTSPSSNAYKGSPRQFPPLPNRIQRLLQVLKPPYYSGLGA